MLISVRIFSIKRCIVIIVIILIVVLYKKEIKKGMEIKLKSTKKWEIKRLLNLSLTLHHEQETKEIN